MSRRGKRSAPESAAPAPEIQGDPNDEFSRGQQQLQELFEASRRYRKTVSHRRALKGHNAAGTEAVHKLTTNLVVGSKVVRQQSGFQQNYLKEAARSLQQVTIAALTEALTNRTDLYSEFQIKKRSRRELLIDAQKFGTMMSPFFHRLPMLEFRPLEIVVRTRTKDRLPPTQESDSEEEDAELHPTKPPNRNVTNVTADARQKFMHDCIGEAIEANECALDFVWSPHYHEIVENMYDLGVLAAGGRMGSTQVGISYEEGLPFLTKPYEVPLEYSQTWTQTNDAAGQKRRTKRFPLIWELSKADHQVLLQYYEDHPVRFSRTGEALQNYSQYVEGGATSAGYSSQEGEGEGGE